MARLTALDEELQRLVDLPGRRPHIARRIAQLDAAVERQLAVANGILQRLKALTLHSKATEQHLEDDLRFLAAKIKELEDESDDDTDDDTDDESDDESDDEPDDETSHGSDDEPNDEPDSEPADEPIS